MLRYYTVAFLIQLIAQRTLQQNPRNQQQLVAQLRNETFIKSDVVADTMSHVDLMYYMKNPYGFNMVEIIGYVQACPSYLYAYALETLKDHIKEGSNVLDVNCDNGYLAACMMRMVGKTGNVTALDFMKEDSFIAEDNVRLSNPELFEGDRFEFVGGMNVLQGKPEKGPFDAIHIGNIVSFVPKNLKDQLKVGGRLMATIATTKGVHVNIYDKLSNGTLTMFKEEGAYFQ